MDHFEHERLDAYNVAIELLSDTDVIARDLPRGRAYLADQLRRAVSSIVLNIAEGAGEYAAADKARFYRMARRSATETAAILDVCRVLALLDPGAGQACRGRLLRVDAMLTARILKLTTSESGSGSGSGSG